MPSSPEPSRLSTVEVIESPEWPGFVSSADSPQGTEVALYDSAAFARADPYARTASTKLTRVMSRRPRPPMVRGR
jgi:hypothetical protein